MTTGDKAILFAAGLFAGEGWAGTLRSGIYKYPQLSLAMYDKRCVTRFANEIRPLIGERSKPGAPMKSLVAHTIHHQTGHDLYTVKVTGVPAIPVLEALYEHLKDTDKGDQIKAALAVSNPKMKLTRTKAQEIRNRYIAGGVTHRELAESFGISVGHVSKVVRGESWA